MKCLDPSRVFQIGFLISGKQEGSFRLWRLRGSRLFEQGQDDVYIKLVDRIEELIGS